MKPYYDAHGITLYCGALADVLPSLGAAFADCIVADPPYAETSLAWDRWPAGWPSAVRPALKPSGSLWCFGSLRMFLDRRDDFAAWKLSQDIVWEKHNGSNFHADRFKRVHENVTHWYPREVLWGDVFRTPVTTPDATARTVRRKKRPPHTGHIEASSYASEDGGPRLMRSVIYVRSCHGYAENETQKPEDLVQPLIEYACPVGGLVFSPFAGSGTDLVVAKKLGKRAVGIDLREAQCEVAARRLEDIETGIRSWAESTVQPRAALKFPAGLR